MRSELLEMLQRENADFLSNLKREPFQKRVLEQLYHSDLQRYGLAEWEYALSYLTDEPLSFTGYPEIREFLHNYQ